jgi:hypothetical protein
MEPARRKASRTGIAGPVLLPRHLALVFPAPPGNFEGALSICVMPPKLVDQVCQAARLRHYSPARPRLQLPPLLRHPFAG